MKKTIIFVIIALFMAVSVNALPPAPFEIWGTITYKGQQIEEGLDIYAMIDGEMYERTTKTINWNDETWYIFRVYIDNPITPEIEGLNYGDIIDLYIGRNYVGSLEVRLDSGFAHNIELSKKPKPLKLNGNYCKRYPGTPYCKW